jgi:hypothetical protein
MVASGGCFLHPPYGDHLNHNSTIIPPVGAITHQNNLPPAERLMEPGPGVGGPGPGVMMGNVVLPSPGQMSQLAFVGPDGLAISWDVSSPGAFDSEPLIAPARYNFPQGAIYRLKLTNVPGRPGVELYPTVEVAPSTPRTDAYLAHNAIPVQFTEEDLDQVLSGNFVTKVIYLPDAEFQELALAGVETLVSTRLDPGVDPVVEADRRGTILAIIRVGNKDLEIPVAAGVEGAGGAGGAGLQAGYMGGPGGQGCPVPCGPAGAGSGGPQGGGIPPAFVAGVTAPMYGMPITGTPIGLPGPPHIPMGIPAGLQRHTIANHTKSHIPGPVKHFKVDVKQEPGYSYPQPVSHVSITERNYTPPALFHQPHSDKHVGDAYAGDDCADGCDTQGCETPQGN